MIILWICQLFVLVNKVDLKATCGSSYNCTEGVISSFSPYNRSQDCYWEIEPSVSASYIKLTWKKFVVDGVMPSCQNDFVEVFLF